MLQVICLPFRSSLRGMTVEHAIFSHHLSDCDREPIHLLGANPADRFSHRGVNRLDGGAAIGKYRQVHRTLSLLYHQHPNRRDTFSRSACLQNRTTLMSAATRTRQETLKKERIPRPPLWSIASLLTCRLAARRAEGRRPRVLNGIFWV
jgi:hypothetical protein